MPEYIARAVTVLDFSNPKRIKIPKIFQVQLCVIKLEYSSIDIGSSCYSDRAVDKNGAATKVVKNSHGVYVCKISLESFDSGRVALLQQLVRYTAHNVISTSQKTIETFIKKILAFFRFYWLQVDLNYSQIENQVHFEEAAKRYSAKLNANQKYSTSYKHQRTRAVFEFSEFLYGHDKIDILDYDVIQNTRHDRGVTKPLLPDKLELALSLRFAIFEGVVDLLTNKKTFPFPLTVPVECKELNNMIWLGYSPWCGISNFPRATDFNKHKPKEWFNREKGELISKGQFYKKGFTGWNSVQHGLKVKNLDHSREKLFLAEYASLCFLDLLMSITGMNQQPALDLPWYGGYFIQKGRQGTKTIFLLSSEAESELVNAKEPNLYIRSIKNRKGYQPVEVEISNRFLPMFKKYLQLRKYYLNGVNDARLFPFSAVIINRRRESLFKNFPEIPRIGARTARAGVSDYILTEVNDPSVAALVLQNDLKTVIKHYAAGTKRAHIQGMGGYFNSLAQQIRITRKANISSMETAVGNCNQGGTSPAPLLDAPFDIDCSQQEGCFFCKHFSVHADEIDIRKLVSVLYYLNKSATRAYDVNYFNDLFGLVIKRINDLLDKIENISAKKKRLVSQIKEEVFVNHKLDEYWLHKLKRLETLTGDR